MRCSGAAGDERPGVPWVFASCLYLLVMGAVSKSWWQRTWGGGTGTKVRQPAPHHQIVKGTIEPDMSVSQKCVFPPKVCCGPALALMQSCLLLAVWANHFYFAMEIILLHFILWNVNRFMMFCIAYEVSFVYQWLGSYKLFGFLLKKSIHLALVYLEVEFLIAHCIWACAISSICFWQQAKPLVLSSEEKEKRYAYF